MVKLQHAKLYETRWGLRFRVFLNEGRFICPKVYQGSWDSNGFSDVDMDFDLVKEIEEFRWVNAHFDDITEGDVFRIRRDHFQKRIPYVWKPKKNSMIIKTHEVDLGLWGVVNLVQGMHELTLTMPNGDTISHPLSL